MKKTIWTLSWLTATAITATVNAQTTTNIEEGPDGVKYRVTRQVVQKSVPTTEYQPREQKVYRPQVTTEIQSYQQTYLTPVTQYQYVPHLRNRWNPFVAPYWTHDLQPVTRWESRPATVQVPVARTNWVESTVTTQVPVTTYRTVADEHTYREIVSVAPNSAPVAAAAPVTTVASRPMGSQQLQSDPPRSASPWATRRQRQKPIADRRTILRERCEKLGRLRGRRPAATAATRRGSRPFLRQRFENLGRLVPHNTLRFGHGSD